ncbi:hypothetical protein [Rhodococcoides fascians]|uniref:hypothetical protein n=1 Tax=Rhodococcoides fascians TaxID=1828 RepID=UPI00055E039C|nr:MULTISPECIES: hypothetical protein [Rhodococcus]OZE96371.1 hypothetical protein CH301_19730 [Rhodococcus sp. 15-1189-1-1a]OZF10959.1 hypothetical protein CH299_20250 [Rhodococcus sp. 14-2686-1-2]
MYSPVTHIHSRGTADSPVAREALSEHREEVTALVAAIGTTMHRDASPFWFPGWEGEIEAALLDAVFAARASYGGEGSGVRRVIARWRTHRGDGPLDDLSFLASFVDRVDELDELLGNRQRVAGNSTTKAEAAAKAAATLIGVGVTGSKDLVGADDDGHRHLAQADAFTSVTGIGFKTWRSLVYLVGVRDSEDSLLVQFVSNAIGEQVDECGMLELTTCAAEELGTDSQTLRHALWRELRRASSSKKTAV